MKTLYTIEYRTSQYGNLRFLKDTITNVEQALKKASELKDKGYYDVSIRTKEVK